MITAYIYIEPNIDICCLTEIFMIHSHSIAKNNPSLIEISNENMKTIYSQRESWDLFCNSISILEVDLYIEKTKYVQMLADVRMRALKDDVDVDDNTD